MSRRYCRCGHPLWWKPFERPRMQSCYFIDDLEGSLTQGRLVIRCLSCNRLLLSERDVTKDPPKEHHMSAMPDAEGGLEKAIMGLGEGEEDVEAMLNRAGGIQ